MVFAGTTSTNFTGMVPVVTLHAGTNSRVIVVHLAGTAVFLDTNLAGMHSSRDIIRGYAEFQDHTSTNSVSLILLVDKIRCYNE